MSELKGGQLNEIMKMAQQVAANIATGKNGDIDISDPSKIDMSQVVSKVSESVSQMMTPDFINRVASTANLDNSNQNLGIPPLNTEQIKNSKIKLDDSPVKTKRSKKVNKIQQIEELDDDEQLDTIRPRTKDLNFTLNVTLEELYSGKTKKLAVKRKKLVEDINGKKIIEEKKKLLVKIEPGMQDEQIITFNHQADEKEGYETGDIIITISCSEHDTYERESDNLIIEKEISLAEVFSCEMTVLHLNSQEINVKCENIDICGEELDLYRKLKGYGMPIYGSDGEFGDLIIKFKPIINTNITKEQIKTLETIFPKINELKKSKQETYQLELATESDFEFSDSESSDEFSDSDEDSEDSEEDSEEESEDSEEESEESEELSKRKKKGRK